MTQFQVRLLGPPLIESAGCPIQVDTRKAIALLVYLVVTGGQQPRDILAALLWPDYDQAHSRSALRRTLSSLKQSLGGIGLSIQREAIGLEKTSEWWIDLHEFESHLAACSNHNHSILVCRENINHLTSAVDLVRGEFLAGFSLRDSSTFDDWQSLQSEGVRQKLAFALENLSACHTFLGEYDQAIAYSRRLQAVEPLNEKATRDLMRLYTWTGRRDAGLRQYHDLSRILDAELHIPPDQETTRLYTEILENSLVPPHIPRVRPEVRPNRIYSGSPSLFPMVGRKVEWAQLLDFYTNSKSTRAFAAIEGEIGVGKTRFAEEFLVHASQNGSVVIGARFFEGEVNFPYGPYLEGIRSAVDQPGLIEFAASLPEAWLVEIARLFPEVAHLAPQKNLAAQPESSVSQARLYEAVDRLIQWVCQGPHPGILFLDDLQWADTASVELLAYLLHKQSGYPLFVLGTWRKEDVQPGHRIRNLLVEAQRSGSGRLIGLNRLVQTEVFELIQSVPGRQLSADIQDKLYQESEGLPYFLTEYLSAISPLDSQMTAGQFPLPASVRELLNSRLAQISPSGRDLLSTAAAIGRSFEFDTLSRASQLSDETTIHSLEELLSRAFIRSRIRQSDNTDTIYDFSHDKLRSLVYEQISRPRRRLIHKHIAEALVERSDEHDDASLAGQIAFHYRQAGELPFAAKYYHQAGDYARSIFAIPDALNHLQSALSLGYPDQVLLYEAIGDLQTLSGSYLQAIESYQACLIRLPSNQSAPIFYKLAQVNHRLGDWNSAEQQFNKALQEQATVDGTVLRIDVLVDWSLTALYKDGLAAAQDLANQALSLAQVSQDCRLLSEVHNILGILARKEGHLDLAHAYLLTSLDYAERANDRSSLIASLNNLALTTGEAENFDQAIQLAQRALELCALIGDRHREAALLSNLADLYYQADESDTAMIYLKKSVAIFSEIGAASGDIQPEIWKMTEW